MDNRGILKSLTQTIRNRINADPSKSYVASLFNKGQDEILKKILEEAGEVTFASKDGESGKVICEVADLIFHLMIVLEFHGASVEDVLDELVRRDGVSGILEKQTRNHR